MPTVAIVRGWRLFFYSNEGNEPIHVHARKAEAECKYWLNRSKFEIEEAAAFNMNPRLTNEVRRVIYDQFDAIVEAWDIHSKR